MRRANACERPDFPRTVFPDGWAISHKADINPEAVSDWPPFCHKFEGEWSNIQVVPIRNINQGVSFFGRGRGRGYVLAQLLLASQEKDAATAQAIEYEENCELWSCAKKARPFFEFPENVAQ